MAREVERKFLVCNNNWKNQGDGQRIVQAYLAKGDNCVFRVRVAGERAWLTIKGKRNGISGDEFEYAIPVSDASALLDHYAQFGVIEKIRYKIPYQGMIWEVDEFLGANQGLVVAEIELSCPEQQFPRPDWLGLEVSDDPRYANYHLSQHPYTTWKD